MTTGKLENLSPLSFWDGQKYRFCPRCQQLAFEFAKAYGLEIRQAVERAIAESQAPKPDDLEDEPFGPRWVRAKIDENERGFGRKS